MQAIGIEELKKIQKEILDEVVAFCNTHNIRYFLAYGTLLGAIRHKGYIPWDDDIDIHMPRPDYEKFYAIWNQVGDLQHYALCRTTKEKNIHQTDMQLVDLTTTFINRHSRNEDILHGVSVDIMPFEGCPENPIARGLQIYHSILYSIFNVQRLPDHQGGALRFATSIVLNAVKDPVKRYKIWSRHEKKMAQYDFDSAKTVKETITSFRALFYPHPRADFETMEVPFEDILVPIPVGYDAYLRRIFGDYMQLPPEEGRVAKHDVVYANLNEPFEQYKGIHYCVKK